MLPAHRKATVRLPAWLLVPAPLVLQLFDRLDQFEFTVAGNVYSDQKVKIDLDKIYVVPDPYIAAHTLEPRLIRQTGRGQRRIDFVNLPPKCKISIFTMSGHKVQEIDHDSPLDNGCEPPGHAHKRRTGSSV